MVTGPAGLPEWGAFRLGPESSVLAESPETISFNEHIRPLLAEHRLHCHGPDASQRKGDLRLDLEAAARSVRSWRGTLRPAP